MVNVELHAVLAAAPAADAMEIIAAKYVVAHCPCDLCVLDVVCHAAVLILQAPLLTYPLSFCLLVIFDKHRDDSFNAPENHSENYERL